MKWTRAVVTTPAAVCTLSLFCLPNVTGSYQLLPVLISAAAVDPAR
jgi:hypothetical protein